MAACSFSGAQDVVFGDVRKNVSTCRRAPMGLGLAMVEKERCYQVEGSQLELVVFPETSSQSIVHSTSFFEHLSI
jgi:hypothetical protein